MNRWDDPSAFFRQITEYLGASHPLRLGSATLLGLASQGIVKIVARGFDYAMLAAAADLPAYSFVAIWGAVLFVPLFPGWKGAPETAVEYVRTLKLLLEQERFTHEEKRQIWRTLIHKYLSEIKPDFSGRPTAKKIFDESLSELSSSEDKAV